MTNKARKYLIDIHQAIALIELFTQETPAFTLYQADLKTKSAVERQLSIIGEAVNNFRKEESDYILTHTKQIVDFRNLLIHAYDSLDDTIVWTILINHLPILKIKVEMGLNSKS